MITCLMMSQAGIECLRMRETSSLLASAIFCIEIHSQEDVDKYAELADRPELMCHVFLP